MIGLTRPARLLSRELTKLGRKGSSTVEYAALVAVIGIGTAGAVGVGGETVKSLFSRNGNGIAMVEGTVGSHAQTSDPSTRPTLDEDCETSRSFSYSGIETHLESNIWNPGAAGGDVQVCLTTGSDNDSPSLADSWGWEWYSSPDANQVVAYPEVIFGQKPWSERGLAPSAQPIGHGEIELDYDYTLIETTGRYNVSISTWLTDRPEARSSAITDEIMIWIENQGMTPAGSVVARGITIDGATYDLWQQPHMADASGSSSHGWSYYTFTSHGTSRAGSIEIDRFLEFLVDTGRVHPDRFISSVEFGTEIIDGSGALQLVDIDLDGLRGYSGAPDTAEIADFSFPDTHLPYAAPARVGSAYLDIAGLDGIQRPFSLAADDENARPLAVSNTMSGAAAESGFLQWGTALEITPPAPGRETIVSLDVDGTVGTWRITRAPAPSSEIGDFSFEPATIAWSSGQARVVSNYVTIPGVGNTPTAFSVTTPSGTDGAVAQSNVVAGGPASEGELTQGTSLVVDVPDYGQTTIVTMTIGGRSVDWQVSREPLPDVQPFSFRETILAWDETRGRINSDYLDIPGLEFVPLDYSLEATAGGNARAVSNVHVDPETGARRIADGTMLEVDTPARGKTNVVSLTVDGQTGTWVVRRDDVPNGPDFSLTNNNGQNFAQINFNQLGIPNKPYRFTLSSTGGISAHANNVSDGSPTDGWTQSWGINIHYDKPRNGRTETITLVIDGQELTWTAHFK